jgi:hypothetical protein
MFIVSAAASCGAFQFGGCTSVTGATGYLTEILTTIVTIGWIVAAIFLAVGAIQYITSAGDKVKATEAKQTLTNALIGIVILLLIGSILTLVSSFFTGGTDIKVPTAPVVNTTP